MGFTEFKNDLIFKADQNKPEIMLAAGILGIVGATILACRATRKAEELISDRNEEENDFLYSEGCKEKIEEDGTKVIVPAREITDEDRKVVKKIYVKYGLKVAKCYAPVVALELASFGLIIKANSVQKDRLSGLAAAYMAVDQAYKKYRQAVINELGEEKDIEFRTGAKKGKLQEIVEDEEGNKKLEKTEGYRLEDGTYVDEYSRFFDESCPDWKKSPELNKQFLMIQQSQANEKLKIQGHLFLNEVYDMLGIPRSAAGAMVGWLYPSDRFNNLQINGFVDFGMTDVYKNPNCPDFINGYERSILLNFNPDGCIYKYI